MVVLSIYIVGFCAVAFLISSPGTDGREAAALGSAIFCPIAVALCLGGVEHLYRRTRLTIADDRLSYTRRSLFKPRAFTEPLSAYACVLPESSISGSKDERMRLEFYARLVHLTDDAKNSVMLVRVLDELELHLDQGGERKVYEDLARSLDLPLAMEAAGGTVSIRYPDELDMNLREYAEAAGLQEEPGPERPFPTRRYRVVLGPDGMSATRGYPAYFIPFAAFAAGAVAARTLLDSRGIDQPLPLVLGFFALFMLAFSLTRARFELRSDSVAASYTVAGVRILSQSIPLREIEELTVVKDPRYRRRVLRIASDRLTISWGAGDGDAELAWFKDAVLRALRSPSK